MKLRLPAMCGVVSALGLLVLWSQNEVWEAEVELDGDVSTTAAAGSQTTQQRTQNVVGGPTYELFSLATMKTKPTGAKFNPSTDVEVVWQKPAGASRVLFLAHGCSHGAIDFWKHSKGCPKCIGLPEELTIVRTALARRYMVVAISSMDREFSRCWRMSFPTDPAVDDDEDTDSPEAESDEPEEVVAESPEVVGERRSRGAGKGTRGMQGGRGRRAAPRPASR